MVLCCFADADGLRCSQAASFHDPAQAHIRDFTWCKQHRPPGREAELVPRHQFEKLRKGSLKKQRTGDLPVVVAALQQVPVPAVPVPAPAPAPAPVPVPAPALGMKPVAMELGTTPAIILKLEVGWVEERVHLRDILTVWEGKRADDALKRLDLSTGTKYEATAQAMGEELIAGFSELSIGFQSDVVRLWKLNEQAVLYCKEADFETTKHQHINGLSTCSMQA